MSRPAWCPTCQKAFETVGGAERCPVCFAPPSPATSGPELSNTLAQTHDLARFAKNPDALAAPPPVFIPSPGPLEVTAEMDCPRCAEKIKAKARVCRFCGHDFEGEDDEDDGDEEQEPVGAKLRRRARQRDERQGPPPGWEYSLQPAAGSFWWYAWLFFALCAAVVWIATGHPPR